MTLLLIILFISLCIVLYINYSKEHFCPTHISKKQNKLILWENDKPTKLFNTYEDYTKYHNFLQSNYKTKGKSCSLLTPKYKPTSNNALKDWVDTNLHNKWYNIEYFQGNPQSKKTKLLEAISKTKENYLLLNPTCLKNIKSNNKDYYKKFVSAYSVYLRNEFKKSLKYIPKSTSENNMTLDELNVYYSLLSNMPTCDRLIKLYNKQCSINKWNTGWTYIKQPKLPKNKSCLISTKNIKTKVNPLLDEGIPVGALSISQIDSLTPKFKYYELNKI